MKKELRIGLLWHSYPSENLGVGALSCAQLMLLDQLLLGKNQTAEYFIVGMMPRADNKFGEITSRKYNYEYFSIKEYAKKPWKFLELRKDLNLCDLILDLSEGDSFTDIYGWRRFLQQALTKGIAASTGQGYVLSPQTIGPFNKWYGKSVSAYIMNRIDAVFARDERSLQYIEREIPKEKSHLAADLAFILPYERKKYAQAPGPINVGLNVSGLLLSGGYSGGNQFGLKLDYLSLVREFLKHFLSLPNVRVHLIPHVITDRYELEDDYRASIKIQKEFPECVIAPRFASPSDAKSYIANMDFFSGARMHATIAAFSSGVPVVPIAYSRKFGGLFGSLGYTQYLVDGAVEDHPIAMKKIIEAFDRRETIKEALHQGNDIAKKRLKKYSDYLSSKLFGEGS